MNPIRDIDNGINESFVQVTSKIPSSQPSNEPSSSLMMPSAMQSRKPVGYSSTSSLPSFEPSLSPSLFASSVPSILNNTFLAPSQNEVSEHSKSPSTNHSKVPIKTNPPKYEFENVTVSYILSMETTSGFFSQSQMDLIEETTRDFLNYAWPYDAVRGTIITEVKVKYQSISSGNRWRLRRRFLQSAETLKLELIITGAVSPNADSPYDFSGTIATIFSQNKLVLGNILAGKGIMVTLN
jgi:hypothetical protein